MREINAQTAEEHQKAILRDLSQNTKPEPTIIHDSPAKQTKVIKDESPPHIEPRRVLSVVELLEEPEASSDEQNDEVEPVNAVQLPEIPSYQEITISPVRDETETRSLAETVQIIDEPDSTVVQVNPKLEDESAQVEGVGEAESKLNTEAFPFISELVPNTQSSQLEYGGIGNLAETIETGLMDDSAEAEQWSVEAEAGLESFIPNEDIGPVSSPRESGTLDGEVIAGRPSPEDRQIADVLENLAEAMNNMAPDEKETAHELFESAIQELSMLKNVTGEKDGSEPDTQVLINALSKIFSQASLEISPELQDKLVQYLLNSQDIEAMFDGSYPSIRAAKLKGTHERKTRPLQILAKLASSLRKALSEYVHINLGRLSIVAFSSSSDAYAV